MPEIHEKRREASPRRSLSTRAPQRLPARRLQADPSRRRARPGRRRRSGPAQGKRRLRAPTPPRSKLQSAGGRISFFPCPAAGDPSPRSILEVVDPPEKPRSPSYCIGEEAPSLPRTMGRSHSNPGSRRTPVRTSQGEMPRTGTHEMLQALDLHFGDLEDAMQTAMAMAFDAQLI